MNHPSPTARLTYRRMTLADAPFLRELLNSPGWLQYIGDRGVYTVADAEQYLLDKIFPAYERPGCGPMLAVRKTDGTILGNVGVYDRPGLDVPDFGFAFLPEYHGRGYAYEAAVAGMEYAAGQGFTELLAITLPANEPSRKLLAKLGFVADGTVSLPDDSQELLRLRWTK